ncbi:hypothetical protein ML5_4161 [Micromonospora sp. L5]|uniref:hypothetical protein n=1 Tax=Micromonospora sp. (strain L5) TaxID=648999 RepID=UPI0001EFABF5|nr:hypothetical protein [Micromonospora sp. L5]ADU09669.1 hypothetical protein ML5_4161 [Micromonospora sp. L5]
MNALDTLLADAAAQDTAPPLIELLGNLTIDEQTIAIRDSAGGPLGHLTCRATVHALEIGTPPGSEIIDALLVGLTSQRSLLTLNDAVDALLDSGPFVQQFGQRLCDALLRGHTNALGQQPLLAASHLEGALRLAIVNAARPVRVLSALELDDVTRIDPEYAERLPRLIGAALDRWGADENLAPPLRQDLDSLREVPDAAADATFEYGLDLLRRAANQQAANALALLLEAREQMATAVAAEENRDDAALYGAGLDAIMAFSRADRDLLVASRDSVSSLLNKREAWLRGLHTPAWRRPRREAERAWARLVLILDNAAEHIAAPAWLNVWEALAAVLDAYELDREVIPVPGISNAPGLEAVVRPMVEQSIVREQSLLAGLRHAAEVAASADDPPIDAAQLQLLLTHVDVLTERPIEQRHAREPGAASEDDSPALLRLVERAPSLVARLGLEKAMRAAQGMTDDALDLMEGVAYRETFDAAAGPQVDLIRRKLEADLAKCPDYAGRVRQYFDLLTWELATFLAARHDVQLTGKLAYLKPFPAGRAPHEEKLQVDYFDWLQRGKLVGRVQFEVSHVATGRVDIQAGFGTVRFYIEIKRELHDASNAALEKSYLTQAADYAGTNSALGQLLVLDLTDHSDGVRHLRESAWVATHRPTGSSVDRYVVVGVVIGNRDTPRSYSD